MTFITQLIIQGILRDPASRFENLHNYPFGANYTEIDGYRVHYLDEGPATGTPSCYC